MRQSHLLVFPSLFDGFGLVLLEAMGCGVPILASERTGAPDILQEGKEGFLVKAASSEDIADVLSRVLDNREQLAEMGAAARRKAASLSWTEYRRRLASLVASDFGFAQ
jgi:glycosyltransferase involved in cell wall biosynthesis